jgi:DUF4097 and DUF4098 domain-containing protein YvlB
MPTYVRQQEISHRIGASGRLHLRVTDADVRLQANEDEEVRLRATFEIRAGSDEEADRTFAEARLDVAAGDGVLEVADVSGRGDLGSAIRRLVSGRGHIGLSVEGTAPRRAGLRIEGVSGDLVIEGARGEQRYTTVNGDVYGTDLGGSVQVTTVSGDATLRAPESLALRVQTVSGDLSAVTPLLREARMNTVSGDLELEAALDRTGDFRAESVSGDLVLGLIGGATVEVRGLSSDIHAEVNHRVEGSSDRRRIVIGDGTPRLVFSSMSGDVNVRRPRRLDASSASQSGAPGESASRPPLSEQDSLEILRALERGDIDVDEAARRLGENSNA